MTSALDATVERHDCPLEVPFDIAHGSTTVATVVAVELRLPGEAPELTGIGAAQPMSYYGETPDSAEAALPALLDAVGEELPAGDELEDVDNTHDAGDSCDAGDSRDESDSHDATDVHDAYGTEVADEFALLGRIEDRLHGTAPDEAAARAAVSIALYDRLAKRHDRPLHRCWDLDPDDAPPTSFSIGYASPEDTAERAAAAVDRGYDHLKIKLGTDRDRARLKAVRAAAPEAAIRVDANCAWDRETAIERLDLLTECDVELVEQPMPADDVDALRAITERSPVPVAADESCVTAADVPSVADACDVVVCKLTKCGGIGPAREQIAAAHEHGLDVMLGCMVESNASIAAAWQLAPLVEYADLDGALLLAQDPYDGIPIHDGVADLAGVGRPGTGAVRVPQGQH